MKKNSKNMYKEINDFFESPPTLNQKAWGIINEFYHLVLTYMEKNDITQAELARRLGKSRSAISQMFNKTPNVTVKKMIQIADAVGLDLNIISKEVKEYLPVQNIVKYKTEYIYITLSSDVFDKKTVDIRQSQKYKKHNKTTIPTDVLKISDFNCTYI